MQDDYPASYYAATRNDHTDYPALDQDLSVETCVVGAGFAGLMTCLGLLERGAKSVALLESHKIGWGASGRNGGLVFGGYSQNPRQLVQQLGQQQAKEIYGLTVDAVELIRQRISKYQIACDLVDEGVIWANWFKDQRLLLDTQSFMADQLGVDWRYLKPDQLAQLLPSERYHGGLFEANAFHFHPLNYARGIARVIHQQGGQIFEHSEVIDCDFSGHEKILTTKFGHVRCKNVVIAGGGYLGKFCPPVSRSILPIATYVMTTEALGDRLNQIMPTKAAIYDSRFAFDYYRPLGDSRLLWGGRINARVQQPTDLQKLLHRDLIRVFPALKDVSIDFAWQGWMAYARHLMPQIGQLENNVWYNTGYGGHGVAPTTMGGELIAAAIVNQDQSHRAFSRWGLPWNGGMFGPVAAQSNYWWYQFKDWMKEALE